MKVLLSNPPWWEGRETALTADGARVEVYRSGVRAGSRWPFTLQSLLPPNQFILGHHYLPYPFFLGYAATYAARETEATIACRDSVALREGYKEYFDFLKANRFDLIVLESATPSWSHDKGLIQEILRRLPATQFVIAGPIASSSEDILGISPQIIAVLKGEYEKNLVKAINGARGTLDFDLLTTAEMNAAPFPYYDELHAHRYFDANPVGQVLPHAQVLSSRGCPFKCIFCVWPASMTGNDPDGNGRRTVRHYHPEYMEAFLTEIVDKYGFRSIYFDDDTFNLGDRHVEDMCRVMRKIGLPWSAMCRADTIRRELWKEMRDSGCFGVKIGFESGNQWVVDNIVNKRLDLQAAREVVREVKRLGMKVHGTFTFGLPGETVEQMRDTERYIATLNLDSLQKSGCAEIEGTPLHTLVASKHLEKYDGARLDDNYLREKDGTRKYEKLLKMISSEGPAYRPRLTHVGEIGGGMQIPGLGEGLPAERVAACEGICRQIPGNASVSQYALFDALIGSAGTTKALILGAYLGRDIAFLMDIARCHQAQIELVALDKFTDDYCDDWPHHLREMTWEAAGFGAPPNINLAMEHLNRLGIYGNIRLMKGRDEDYLPICAEEYDLIVLDTSHDYATLRRQIPQAARLLALGGWLAGTGYMDGAEVSRAVREFFPEHWVVDGNLWLAGRDVARLALRA